MTIFDLLFIVVFFATVITLAVAAVAAVRGRGRQAVAILRNWAIFAAVYFAILMIVSLATPQRVLSIGDDQCSDDWCIAVASAERTPGNAVVSYAVTLRVSSRARRVAQRERGVSVYLVDDRGRHYDPAPAPSEAPFDVMLQPGESVTTTRRFELPADARDVGLAFARGSFPGFLIIGNEGNLFHKKTVVRLD